ncbi:MAG TPA: hypothetical protein VNA88_02160 [Candidatus Kapabacteria bacterium]|nr:hypothetical protein [Candidatus Kapabacteria bacterium]
MAKEIRKKPETRSAARPASRNASTRPYAAPAVDLTPLWSGGIIALVTLVFFSGHLFGGAFLWEDFAEFTYPNQVFAARSFAAGILPFWNPYTFNGMPFLADLQIGFFYPGNLLMYLLSGGELSSSLAQLFVVLHFPLAMVGAERLARGLGIGRWGSVFAGVAYGLSGVLVAHMIHPNMLFHLAWFPLIVHLFRRGVDERSWLHALLAGLALGVAMLSGHPQSALYIVFFLFVLTIVLLVRRMRAGDDAGMKGLVAGALCALVPIALGAGIFAIQLLPSQELAALSERATMTYEKSLEGSMTLGQIFTLVVPKVFGVAGANPQPETPFWLRPEIYYYWETAIYVGVVTLLLAAIGLASRSLRTVGLFFAAMGLLGVLYGLGDSFFVHPILARLPLFGTFRSPARLAMYLSLGAAILAGAGLDRLARGGADGALARVALIAGAIIAGIGLLTVTGILPSLLGAPAELGGSLNGTGAVALIVGGAAAAIAWMRLNGRMAGTVAAALLVLLGAIDLFVFGMTQNASEVDPQVTYANNDAQFAVYRSRPPDSLFRLRMREGGAMLMQRNQGPYSGIMLFEGYNPLLLARRVPPAYDPEKAFDFMNIRYSAKIDSQAQQVTIADRPSAYAHARMLYDVRVGSTEQVLAMLKDPSIDFGRTVLLEKDPGIATDGSGTGTARFTRYDASELELDVTTDKPGILVLSEVWYPAWKVQVDGRDAELLQADYSLRGVALPAGRHRVAMRYESDAFATGRLVTIIALVAGLGGVAVAWLRHRRAASSRLADTESLDVEP